MPPADQPQPPSLDQIVEEIGIYPAEAFRFVQAGLEYTVQKIHGAGLSTDARHHVTGQELCQGLREFALLLWGMMARAVLRRWNITTTYDFGRIVFALIEYGHMARTDDDTIDDFRHVYEFAAAFDAEYRIECAS